MEKILRAWDYGKNRIKYVHKDENTGRSKISDIHYDWFFFIKTKDYENRKSFFMKLIEEKLINKTENDGTYTKIFVDRCHENEFLDKDCKYSWMYADKTLNYVLKLLKDREIKYYEADLSVSQRWILSENIEFESNLKTLFVDIETDDSNIRGQPIPGEFQILSIGMIDGQTGKRGFLICENWGDEHEKNMLEKLFKIISPYDVLIAFNGKMFDFPYIMARAVRYGLQIDWRKKHLQDHQLLYKKLGPKLQSYSLDSIAKFHLSRGKIEHSQKIFQMFNENKQLLKEYNMMDVELMVEIEEKTKFLSVAREVNRIGLCPCDDEYISRKIVNLIFKQAYEDKHFHFETKEREHKTDAELELEAEANEEDEQFEGAHVFDPVIGLHKDVKVLDVTGLYPNTIISFNISPDTLITSENESEVKPEQIITNPCGHKFRKDFVGILPKVVMSMANNRDKYKKLKKTVDPISVEYKTFERLDYTFKYYALSLFGVMGCKHSKIFDVRVAEAITLGGQYIIKTTAEYLKTVKIPALYGDTDSMFIQLKNDKLIEPLTNNIFKICEHHLIKKFNCDKSTIRMAYDKGFSKLIIQKKKRYAGNLTYLEGRYINNPSIYIKGLEFVRTDNCNLLKRKQEELLKLMLGNNDITLDEAKIFIEKYKQYVFGNEITLDDIIFAQKLTKETTDYKGGKLMHIKVVEEMRKDNKEVYVSDKIPYFILEVGSDGKPVPAPIYKFKGKFAKVFYWQHKLFPPIQRLLEVVFPEQNWETYLMKNIKGNNQVGRMGLW